MRFATVLLAQAHARFSAARSLTGLPFKVYSGYLTVPGPFELTSYDSLEIHYQFHTSQSNPASDPVVTWHQGGPGGSSIEVGLYTEMGCGQHRKCPSDRPPADVGIPLWQLLPSQRPR